MRRPTRRHGSRPQIAPERPKKPGAGGRYPGWAVVAGLLLYSLVGWAAIVGAIVGTVTLFQPARVDVAQQSDAPKAGGE